MGVGRKVRVRWGSRENSLETFGSEEAGWVPGWFSYYDAQLCFGSDSRRFLPLYSLLHKKHMHSDLRCHRGIPRAQLRVSTLALKYRWTHCICQITSRNKAPGRPWPTVRKLFGRVLRMRRKHLTACIFIKKIAALGKVSIWANVSVNVGTLASNKSTVWHDKRWW